LKEKILADAGGSILQCLSHDADATDAGEEEDAVSEVLALHKEIDGEDDDYTEGPDGAEKAHEKFSGGLKLSAIGVDDTDGLGARVRLLRVRSCFACAGGEVPADVLDGGEGGFKGLLCW
jgi:hypothetical protein